MPHALILPLHVAQAEGDLTAAIEASIVAAGCTSSRASIAGACLGAIATDSGVRADWISELEIGMARACELVASLAELRSAHASRL